MKLSGDLGQKFKTAVNSELKNLGVTIDPENTSPNTSDTSIQGIISQLKTISDQYYPKSIMMRGLNIATITPTDWNKLYPYRFIILEAQKNGTYKTYNNLAVTLPITPQNLSITSDFASTLTIGSRGILEEHNGINIKQISFTATTGILVSRQSADLESKTAPRVQAIFGGTVQAVRDFASAVASVFPRSPNETPKVSDDDLLFSGYYQYHLIRAFLEIYAELKKRPEGRRFRLGLELGKDRVVYLVTPQAFNTTKSAAAPMEIVYSFTGIAWGTANITLSDAKALPSILKSNIDQLQATLNALRGLRRVAQKASDIVRAAKSDVETNIYGPLQDIIISIKETLSIPLTIADVPNQLSKSWQQMVVKEFNSIEPLLPESIRSTVKLLVLSSIAGVGASSSFLGSLSTKPDVLNDINIMDSIPLEALALGPAEQDAVSNAIENAQNINNSTVESLINNLQQLSDTLEPQALIQGPDSPVWEILNNLYDAISGLYSLLASNHFGRVTVGEQQGGANPVLDFYQGYVESSGGVFNRPKSKFAIPFPYGTTLEWIAQKYLGDPTRWIEIAAVNNLQPPYIDEEGFTRPFLTNGQGRQFNIESADSLFVGQSIWIFSDTMPVQKRRIKSIQKITNTNHTIVVDGEDNLGQFLLAHNAKMRAYLPNTVNSQKLLYIPMNEETNLDGTQTKSIAYLDETPEMLKLSKIDLLLDGSGDLAVTQDGYQNLAYGKNNLIQAAKLKLQTVAGSLLFHPEYGGGTLPGDSNADFTIDNIVSNIRQAFQDDPRFQSVDSIEVEQKDGVLKMRVYVTVANNQGLVPVEFEVET